MEYDNWEYLKLIDVFELRRAISKSAREVLRDLDLEKPRPKMAGDLRNEVVAFIHQCSCCDQDLARSLFLAISEEATARMLGQPTTTVYDEKWVNPAPADDAGPGYVSVPLEVFIALADHPYDKRTIGSWFSDGGYTGPRLRITVLDGDNSNLLMENLKAELLDQEPSSLS